MGWISNNWKEYELLDATEGFRLESWAGKLLVRPDPQVIWATERADPRWSRFDAKYHRSSTGGGRWEIRNLPESWLLHYADWLTFHVKPMNFKHTGVFPEQAANWDYIRRKVEGAGRPVRVLNLFAYSGGATLAAAAGGAEVWHVDAAKGMVAMARENAAASGLAGRPFTGLWTTAANSSSGKSAGGGSTTASSWTRPPTAGDRRGRFGRWSGISILSLLTVPGDSLRPAALCAHQLLHHGPGPSVWRIAWSSCPGRPDPMRRAGPACDRLGPDAALRCDGPVGAGALSRSPAPRRAGRTGVEHAPAGP